MKASEARKRANKYAIKEVLNRISNASKSGEVQFYLYKQNLDSDFIKSTLEYMGYLVTDEILTGYHHLDPKKETKTKALLIKW